jgi:CBS domain-containing protein
MIAKDLMRQEVFTIRDDEPVSELVDVLVREHLHGVPVLDGAGLLVGVVTQQDVFFSQVSVGGQVARDGSEKGATLVRDIMTTPALSAEEDTEILALCRMMTRLRIHRVPIVRAGKVIGIISSLDVCGALARGELRAP